MPDLLQIGGITDDMRARLAERFTIHQMGGDYPAEAITHIVTNGHDGVPAAVLEVCQNAKVAASYGVGYDAIDTDTCSARGILVTHTPDVLNEFLENPSQYAPGTSMAYRGVKKVEDRANLIAYLDSIGS